MCVWVGVSAWVWRCARMWLASGEGPSSWLCGWNANTASEINHCLQPWLCDSGWLRATCQASWARAPAAHSWLSISPQSDLWAPGRSVQVWEAPSDGPQPRIGSLDASVPSWALQRASWPKCTRLLWIWVYMGNPRGVGYTFSFYCWDASGKDWIRDRGWERQRSTFVAQPCCVFNQTLRVHRFSLFAYETDALHSFFLSSLSFFLSLFPPPSLPSTDCFLKLSDAPRMMPMAGPKAGKSQTSAWASWPVRRHTWSKSPPPWHEHVGEHVLESGNERLWLSPGDGVVFSVTKAFKEALPGSENPFCAHRGAHFGLTPCAFKGALSTGKFPPPGPPRQWTCSGPPAQGVTCRPDTLQARSEISSLWLAVTFRPLSGKTPGTWWFQLCISPSLCQLTASLGS